MNYRDVVDIIKVSQDNPARGERFETFKRAVAFYGVKPEGHVILVGGTNGKGTVSKTLATLWDAALFTSPHLIEPTERIATGGRDLTPDEMVRAFELISNTVAKFELSHFEILTLMMIEVFWGGRIRPKVERAVIEVGVGGRLDPTRVIPHETAVMARIGLDHEAILGTTLEKIALEKLPIAEGTKQFIFMKPQPEIAHLFHGIEARTFPSRIEKGPRWILETPWGEAPLALMGRRAVENTSLALEVLNAIDFKFDLAKLSTVVWPGRMEQVGERVYLSGDHNEQGVASLKEIVDHFEYETLWLVVGIGKGKPADAMLTQYRKFARAKIVLTKTYFRQIESLDQLDADYKIDDAFEALNFATAQAGPKDLVVVSGSLYLVGDLKARLVAQSARS